MKKLVILTLVLLGITMMTKSTKAYNSDYSTFREIVIEGNQKLLENWTDSEYKSYLAPTNKRKMFGWKINYVLKNAQATFISEVLYSYYNDGTTGMDIKFTSNEENSYKRVTQVKGGLSLTGKASNKKLSGGLEASLDTSCTVTDEYSSKDTWEQKITVDPQTKVVVYIDGTAKVTNGCATKYSMFLKCFQGAFEIFIITSQYPRIEKTRVR